MDRSLPPQAIPHPTKPSLDRSIRRWDLVAATINAIIGAGIFGLPAQAFALAGAYSLLAFVVCALVAGLIVLCFAEVGSRFTATGGPYLYAREAYGAAIGFEVGWLTWLARLTSFSANANLMVQYLGFFFPAASLGAGRAALLCASVLLLVGLNVLGIRDVTAASNVFVVGKLLALAFFIVVGLFFLDSSRFAFAVVPAYGSFSRAVLLLLYAFTGFEMAVIPGGEMKDPRRDLPVAVLTAMAVVVAVYVLVQVVCIGTLPTLAQSQRPLAEAASRFLGPAGAVLITTGLMFSLAGNLNIILLAGSRLLFAMSERRELPGFLALIHPRFHTPWWSVVSTGGIMLTLSLTGTFVSLLTVSTLARLSSYIVTCSALLALRRRRSAPAASFSLPAGGAVSVIAVLTGLLLLSSVGWSEARDTALAAAAGMALFVLAKAAQRRNWP